MPLQTPIHSRSFQVKIYSPTQSRAVEGSRHHAAFRAEAAACESPKADYLPLPLSAYA